MQTVREQGFPSWSPLFSLFLFSATFPGPGTVSGALEKPLGKEGRTGRKEGERKEVRKEEKKKGRKRERKERREGERDNL